MHDAELARRITEAAGLRPRRLCVCRDTGHVCENHPDRPWEGLTSLEDGACECAAAGMPCPACCSPIPEDGTRSIVEAFTPDWQRSAA